MNWQGFYAGVQGGYGSSDENLNGSVSNMITPLVQDNVLQQMDIPDWNLPLGKQSSRTGGFGGFAGYNWQFEDVVMGVEMSYLHANFGGTSSASVKPRIGNDSMPRPSPPKVLSTARNDAARAADTVSSRRTMPRGASASGITHWN